MEIEIQKGYVYQDKKRPERKLCVIEAELNAGGMYRLQNEKTSAVHEMGPDALESKFKLIGKYISEGGEPKFVAMERVGSKPETGASAETAAEHSARLHSMIIDLTRASLGTDRYERVMVLKAKVQCPCGDVHEVKEESFPAFMTSVARMCVRHDDCHKTNVLPGLHEDRIDPKRKPMNGEQVPA